MRFGSAGPRAHAFTFSDLTYSADPYHAAKGAEALLILTEWPEYRALDWKRIRGLMMRPLVLDGRNLLEPAKMSEMGFEYYSFGRPDTACQHCGVIADKFPLRNVQILLSETSRFPTAFNVWDNHFARFTIVVDF